MPLIQWNFLTNEGSKRLGKMITRWGPWIETGSTQAFEEQLADSEVLDTEKSGMKFNKNLIVICKLVNRYKIFLDFRDMEQWW
jgi:hypothetical protein